MSFNDIMMQDALLTLVRAAAGHGWGQLPQAMDWPALFALADRQGVTAIVWDAVEELLRQDQLTGERELPKAVKYDGFGTMLFYEKRFEEYKEVIGALAEFYGSAGMPMMLLKGYGLSLNYPVPAHRPCGDIDVFLFGRQAEADRLLEEQRGIDINYGDPHHSVFYFKGTMVENHVTFLNNNRHQSSHYIEGVIHELLQEPQPTVEVGGQRVYVPTVKLNSVYLLRHMANHFATEKISIRHLLDWALFVEKNAAEVDWEYVTDFARRTNMLRFLSSVNMICVRELGFAEEQFPVPCPDEALAARVLGDILSPEWHGEIPPQSKKLRYELAKTRRLWHNRWKYRIVYDETLLQSFWSLALNRVGRCVLKKERQV